ncbi:MAG: hypothetical protein H6839_01130 [Planctomycetes bacterium]|nr:hypothetical protein [Planctomycetota bacterium]
MTIRICMIALVAVALLATGCESTRKIKDDIKNDATKRTIERARLHSAADLKAAYDKDGGDADEALLLFFNALLLIEEDKDAGFAAAAYMSRPNDQWDDPEGPTGVKPSQMASEGLKRLVQNPEKTRSYTGGKPSDYKMADAEKIVLEIKDTNKISDSEVKFFLWSSGKDNASPVRMKSENGKWYVEEWTSIQTDVQ